VRKSGRAGIYVEVLIRAPLERVWELTQRPDEHQRWDLRFSRIEYLPKSSEFEPQRFLYETRIGFGLAIRGTGKSIATRVSGDGTAISSLEFFSEDRLSLIRDGAGYWRYIPTAEGLRFLTWYDYSVRFGAAGRMLDCGFRPLIGWATAWSFDCLRLWAERGIVPEASRRMAAVHGLARIAISGVWLWHGLVPKLIFRDLDESILLARTGLPSTWLPWIGVAEVGIGLLVLLTWRWRGMFVVQALLMIGALLAVAVNSPAYLTHAFNPVTLNLMVVALAFIGWIASAGLPTAARCLRVDPRSAGAGQ
jgi:hypothetical protein